MVTRTPKKPTKNIATATKNLSRNGKLVKYVRNGDVPTLFASNVANVDISFPTTKLLFSSHSRVARAEDGDFSRVDTVAFELIMPTVALLDFVRSIQREIEHNGQKMLTSVDDYASLARMFISNPGPGNL